MSLAALFICMLYLCSGIYFGTELVLNISLIPLSSYIVLWIIVKTFKQKFLNWNENGFFKERIVFLFILITSVLVAYYVFSPLIRVCL
jgi:hypothetical protein